MATPLSLEEGRIDASDRRLDPLLHNPPVAEGDRHASFRQVSGLAKPSVRGRGISSPTEILEIHRSGQVEYFLPVSRIVNTLETSVLLTYDVVAHVADFLKFLEAVRAVSAISDPYLVTLAFNFGHAAIRIQDSPWEEGPLLRLAPIVTTQDERPGLSARRVCDLLWQAFHFDGCPYFDDEGRITWHH